MLFKHLQLFITVKEKNVMAANAGLSEFPAIFVRSFGVNFHLLNDSIP